MTKEQYIETFVINFVSAYAAIRFDDFCSLGRHKELENLPFEDAVFLATKTWNKFEEGLKNG